MEKILILKMNLKFPISNSSKFIPNSNTKKRNCFFNSFSINQRQNEQIFTLIKECNHFCIYIVLEFSEKNILLLTD